MDPTDVRYIRVENLKRAIGNSSIAAFSRRYGFNSAFLSQLLNDHRKFGEKAARAAEEKMGIPRDSLDVPVRTAKRLRPVGAVPLIPWEWAPRWPMPARLAEIPDDNYLRCAVAVSEATFALQVIDASMQAPAGRTYPMHSIVFVEPTQRDVDPTVPGGVRIIALVQRTPMLRELALHGRQRVLLPLNQQFPIYTGPFTVIGRVLGSWING